MRAIDYELTAEDFVAFNLHFFSSSDVTAKMRRTFRLQITVITALAGLVTLYFLFGRSLLAAVFGMVMSGALMWAASPGVWERQAKANVRKMAATGGLGVPGTHRLTLDGEGLRETGPKTEIAVPWNGIERVDETPTHAFVFFAPNQAVIIPRAGDSSAVDAVVAEIREQAARPRSTD